MFSKVFSTSTETLQGAPEGTRAPSGGPHEPLGASVCTLGGAEGTLRGRPGRSKEPWDVSQASLGAPQKARGPPPSALTGFRKTLKYHCVFLYFTN